MNQLAFSLPSERTSFRKEDFFVTPSNQRAFQMVLETQWPHPYLFLTGPAGSGKTHLAHLWAEQTSATFYQASALQADVIGRIHELGRPLVIEDVDAQTPENGLFHLLNLSKEASMPLLVTATTEALAALTLPDVISRVRAAPKAELEAPDDTLLHALFFKHFSDRQLRISSHILQYLVNRVERSGAEVKKMVAMLDSHAFEKKQNISMALVRKYLP